MIARKESSSSHATRQSMPREQAGYFSRTSSDDLGYHRRSSPTEDPSSPAECSRHSSSDWESRLRCLQPTTRSPMDRQKGRTRKSRRTFKSTAQDDQRHGPIISLKSNSATIIGSSQRSRTHCYRSIRTLTYYFHFPSYSFVITFQNLLFLCHHGLCTVYPCL